MNRGFSAIYKLSVGNSYYGWGCKIFIESHLFFMHFLEKTAEVLFALGISYDVFLLI